MKRRNSRQMCLAETATGASPLRSVTIQPLSRSTHSTKAPTAPGSDCSIAARADVPPLVRLGHRQRDDRRLVGER